MADHADEAQESGFFLELEHKLTTRKTYQGVSPECCDECGEIIEQRRRELLPGVRHCSECAAWLEEIENRRR